MIYRVSVIPRDEDGKLLQIQDYYFSRMKDVKFMFEIVCMMNWFLVSFDIIEKGKK